MSDIAFATLSELALGLAEGRHSSVELAKHFLDRIGRANQALHAYVSVDADSTLRLAEAADARRRAGYGLLGPLDGVPVAIRTCATSKARSRPPARRPGASGAARPPRPPSPGCWRAAWCRWASCTWSSSPSAAGAPIP